MRFNKHIRENNFWRYAVYIIMSSLVTCGLNILHTQYILNIEPRAVLFVIPILAGVLFGYLLANLKSGVPIITSPGEGWVYLKYMTMACFVTSVLNVVHTEWILDRRLEGMLFIMPFFAGIFFGYLLARIKVLNNRLTKLATTDTLTGAYNRFSFDKFFKIEVERSQKCGRAFSIIYIDVDHFKSINDSFGHSGGDVVLVELATLVNELKRPVDYFARYGGEEFIILCSNTNLEEAENITKQLRQKINSYQFTGINKLTCSFGVSEYVQELEDIANVIRRADHALYKAKENGRDRVQVDDWPSNDLLCFKSDCA